MQRVKNTMRVEDLLKLPVGTRVFGDVEIVTKSVPGVVGSLDDGARCIRWADGYVSSPLGRLRDADECVAEHTHLNPPLSYGYLCKRDLDAEYLDNERGETSDSEQQQVLNWWIN